MSKPCHIFFQNKNETQIFTINKPNIMKISKYQHYFHYFTIIMTIIIFIGTMLRSTFAKGKSKKMFYRIFNDCLNKNKSPNLMKIAEIRPVIKQLNNTFVNTIIGLSNFTKLFESILFTQLNRYMQKKFSVYLVGFRKNLNTQDFLLNMIKSWKVRLTNGSKVGVKIMDLSKAFESLNLELLLTKLKTYGLDSNSVTFMKRYLKNMLQRYRVNNSFSE